MINFKFLMELEGFCTQGYVPMRGSCVLGNSGVTIASGFDLGQWSHEDVLGLGISSALFSKLEPYIGKRRGAALGVLARKPLVISDEEALEINEKLKAKYIPQVAGKYNRWSDGLDFWLLPSEIQTVITSVLFQYGVGSIERRAPNFWKQVTQGRWDDAVANLRNFGDAYRTRRNKEADLLEVGIGKLRCR